MSVHLGFSPCLDKYLHFVYLLLSFSHRLCEQSDVGAQAHFSIEEKKEVE